MTKSMVQSRPSSASSRRRDHAGKTAGSSPTTAEDYDNIPLDQVYPILKLPPKSAAIPSKDDFNNTPIDQLYPALRLPGAVNGDSMTDQGARGRKRRAQREERSDGQTRPQKRLQRGDRSPEQASTSTAGLRTRSRQPSSDGTIIGGIALPNGGVPITSHEANEASTSQSEKKSKSASKAKAPPKTNKTASKSATKVAVKVKEEPMELDTQPKAAAAKKSASSSKKPTEPAPAPKPTPPLSSSEGKRKRESSANDDSSSQSAEKKPKKGPKPIVNNEEVNSGFQWWKEDANHGSDNTKWRTLEHNGVLLAPEHEVHGIKMQYNGKKIDLPPACEEVATFYAAVIGTQYALNPVFNQNFFKDFKALCDEEFGKKKNPIQSFEKCDFSDIKVYLDTEKEKKKQRQKEMTREQKVAAKKAQEEEFEKYRFAIVDGRKERVGNFRVEPPGLFRGRGEHPKTGMLKKRVRSDQITINIGENATVPEPPHGEQWGKVVHDHSVTWLACWSENIMGNIKYVYLNHESAWKGMSDKKKFDKARELHSLITKIRVEYTQDLRDDKMEVRQRATALYLIDRLALRAGNEKDNEEADTVGCCSLRKEHVELLEPNVLKLDFLGKDSIRFQKEVAVDHQVFKNLVIFTKQKSPDDDLFDRLNTSKLNNHLTKLMPGLTAKVFRTYNASITFEEQLQELTPSGAPVEEKALSYNRANREVAILCNHQRAVPKGFEDSMSRANDKLRAVKYERQQVKRHMKELQRDIAHENPIYGEAESDLDDDWIAGHEKQLKEKEEAKLMKQLEKDNEKRKEQGLAPLELKDMAKKEQKKTMTSLVKAFDRLSGRIANMKTQMVDKNENKTTATSTSKINYIDPRITTAWCKEHNVPLTRMFNKTLRSKFRWAMLVDKDWRFSDMSSDKPIDDEGGSESSDE